jgi:hypothetical protein
MKSKPKPIPIEKLDTLSMVCGGEKKISRVIHEGYIKNWVGIGWVTERKAVAADQFKYPEVLCQQPQKNGKSSSPKKTRKRCSLTTSMKR